MEENNLLRKGSILVADNVIIPGAPAYLEYVRNNPKYKSSLSTATMESIGLEDGLEISICLEV